LQDGENKNEQSRPKQNKSAQNCASQIRVRGGITKLANQVGAPHPSRHYLKDDGNRSRTDSPDRQPKKPTLFHATPPQRKRSSTALTFMPGWKPGSIAGDGTVAIRIEPPGWQWE